MTWLRTDYLAGKCSFGDYYGQFITQGTIDRVLQRFGRERICASTDPFFNDIPLREWDDTLPIVPFEVAAKFAQAGDYVTLAGWICLMKYAAERIRSGKA